jgi:hypothetical protein
VPRLWQVVKEWWLAVTSGVLTYLLLERFHIVPANEIPVWAEKSIELALSILVTGGFKLIIVQLATEVTAKLAGIPRELAHLTQTLAELSRVVEPMVAFAQIPGALPYVDTLITHEHPRYLLRSMIDDHNAQVFRGHYLLTIDGYLQWLELLSSKLSELLCVNRTLPIYWFSPRSSERQFVFRYLNLLAARPIQVSRITVVKDTNVLRHQIIPALRSLEGSSNMETLHWFLTLIRSITQGATAAKLSLKAIPVFAEYGSKLPPEPWEALLPYLNDVESDLEGAIARVRERFPAFVDFATEILREFLDNDKASLVDESIASLFVDRMGVGGSYYMQEPHFLRTFQESLPAIGGELGVFLNADQTPGLSFTARGDLATCVLIEGLDPHSLLPGLRRCLFALQNHLPAELEYQGVLTDLWTGPSRS